MLTEKKRKNEETAHPKAGAWSNEDLDEEHGDENEQSIGDTETENSEPEEFRDFDGD